MMATYVLVHGAFQGGWIWKDVAERLRAAGHRVYAPSLDGCGERKHTMRPGISTETHAEEIAQLLFYEDLHDVVLVGTSSGGMVACRVAETMRSRIDRLVFVDALVLLSGERILDIVERVMPATGEYTIAPSRAEAAGRMFADLEPATRAWVLERYTPHPIAVYDQPVRLDTFWTQRWQASVVWCRRAPNPGEAHLRRAAERLDASWAELDTGHYPMLSAPEALTARLIADS